MVDTKPLPDRLYTASQVRELDRIAIEEVGIPGITLMRRAGTAAYEQLISSWPEAQRIAVVCGLGNNAGDGYVLARLAKLEELNVCLVQQGDSTRLTGDARTCYEDLQASSITTYSISDVYLSEYDVIVDALFGTGLDRDISGDYLQAINTINACGRPVLSLDIPSGLNADTGMPMQIAVRAHKTISFIGMKQGLLTGRAGDYCGDLLFADLAVPHTVYEKLVTNEVCEEFNYQRYKSFFPRRNASAHKGDFGHVLVIGGDDGFIGAARMAAEAAARTGAGLVSVATRASHAAHLNTGRPELMVHGVESYAELSALLKTASVLAIGPGLGQSPWAMELFARVLETSKPHIIDADGLNLLAKETNQNPHRILTPHPGEAARLLGVSTAEIQQDRIAAAKALQQRYGGVIVLKGYGTVIIDQQLNVAICSDGNPGMATGGMGDVLTGVIAGLLAQRIPLAQAAKLGVCLHAAAADEAALLGQRGLLAADLMPYIRYFANP